MTIRTGRDLGVAVQAVDVSRTFRVNTPSAPLATWHPASASEALAACRGDEKFQAGSHRLVARWADGFRQPGGGGDSRRDDVGTLQLGVARRRRIVDVC